MQYPNFYESLREARMRLNYTLVLYDGEPYQVAGITNHEDGIYRLYLWDIRNADKQRCPDLSDYDDEFIEDWVADNPQYNFIRKKINSPKFNKFRPYPLGMVNYKDCVFYVARQPVRKSEQGLIDQMLNRTHLTKMTVPEFNTQFPGLYQLRDCIKGVYPKPEEVLKALNDPDVITQGAAFDREFAIVKGPLNQLYLAYRAEVVGLMLNNDFNTVLIGRDYDYCKEVVQALGLFDNVIMGR